MRWRYLQAVWTVVTMFIVGAGAIYFMVPVSPEWKLGLIGIAFAGTMGLCIWMLRSADSDRKAIRKLNLHQECIRSSQLEPTMYIRAYSSPMGEERRYVVNQEGHVFFKLVKDMNSHQFVIHRGFHEAYGSGSIKPYRKNSLLEVNLELGGKEFLVRLPMGKDETKKNGMASRYQYRYGKSPGSFVVHESVSKGKIAESKAVFTEAGYSPCNQDVHFYENAAMEEVLLMLTAFTFSWSTGAYIMRT